MFAIILGALVVAFCVAQYLVCPLWYPSMCAPSLMMALMFGFFGVIGIIMGVGVHFEQKAKQRNGRQGTAKDG